MNNTQRTIGVVVSIVFIAMLLYPPFVFISEPHGLQGVVYGFIIDNPEHRNVNIFLLITQMLGVLIIGVIAYFIADGGGAGKHMTGGLWEKKDQKGHIFLIGSLSPIRKIIVVPNAFKKEKKDPDYFFYLGNNEKKAMPKSKTAQRPIKRKNLYGEGY